MESRGRSVARYGATPLREVTASDRTPASWLISISVSPSVR